MNRGTNSRDLEQNRTIIKRLSEEFERVLPPLVNMAFTLTDDANHAEDLVQDTFLTALIHSERFRDDADLLPWLCGILKNRALRHRRDATRKIDAERLQKPPAEEPSDFLHRSQLWRELERTIVRLPSPYRDVVRMRLIGRRTIQEIAVSLERSPSTVRTQLSRGLERVRALLPPGFTGAAVFVAIHEAVASRAGAGPAVAADSARGMPVSRNARRTAGLLAVAVLASVLAFLAATDAAAGIVHIGDTSLGLAPTAAARVAVAGSSERRVRGAGIVGTGVRLTLREAQTGRPAVGLSLRLVPNVSRETVWQNSLPRWRTAVSDEQGIVEFGEVPPGTARLYLDDGSLVLQEFEVARGVPVRMTLEIPAPAMRVSGIVVDPSGAPVPDAEVWASTNTSLCSPGYVAGRSRADGSFEFPVFDPMTYFWARHGGFSPSNELRKANPGGGFQLKLCIAKTPGSLTGRAVDRAGKVLPRAIVGFYPLHRPPDSPPVTYSFTDARGRFRVSDLRPGPYAVVVRSPGLAPAYVRAQVDQGEEHALTFELGPGARISGQVYTSRPVDRLWLAAVPIEPRNIRRGVRRLLSSITRPDERGRFEHSDVPAGDVRLYVFDDPRMQRPIAQQSIRVVAGATQQVMTVIGNPNTIGGRVVDRNGNPLEDVRVEAIVDGFPWVRIGRSAVSATTDRDGRFGLVVPDKASYRCVFHIPGSAGIPSTERRGVRPEEAGLRVVLDPAGAWIRGRLGEAASDFSRLKPVVKSPWFGQVVCSKFEADRVTFRVGPLPEGDYSLYFEPSKEDGTIGAVLWSGRLSAGEQLDLGTVSLPRSGTLDVELSGEPSDSTPVALRLACPGGVPISDLKLVSSRRISLPAGRYALLRERAHSQIDFDILPDKTTRVRVARKPDGVDTELVFKAHGPRKLAIECLRIEVRGNGSSFTKHIPSESDGAYHYRVSLEPGRYQIDAREVGGAYARVEFEVSESGPRQHEFRLRPGR